MKKASKTSGSGKPNAPQLRKDRKSGSGLLGSPKKGGHGGKFTWAGDGYSTVELGRSDIHLAGSAVEDSASGCGATSPSPAGSFIISSCRATTYPAVCEKSLSTYAATINKSPKQQVMTALTVSVDTAESTKPFVKKLTKFRGLKPRVRSAIKDCLEEMNDGVDGRETAGSAVAVGRAEKSERGGGENATGNPASGEAAGVDGRDGQGSSSSATAGASAGVNGRGTERYQQGGTKGEKEAHDLGYQDGGDYWAWH
ncbi:uncharacterized protein LOC130991661 [Salvia miltiorrhiza]|uniref:uncharacterized protein LOC130991661 n=1 Tax=Salvia miltiorrhiza TaxID=226208 RepID=UPI0025AB9046|nr:uncharacterized protein LOC130991661 [Salvia miltiorrhiza]